MKKTDIAKVLTMLCLLFCSTLQAQQLTEEQRKAYAEMLKHSTVSFSLDSPR